MAGEGGFLPLFRVITVLESVHSIACPELVLVNVADLHEGSSKGFTKAAPTCYVLCKRLLKPALFEPEFIGFGKYVFLGPQRILKWNAHFAVKVVFKARSFKTSL